MATGSKKVTYAAPVGNALIAITKSVAASITGSSTVLSEGIHFLMDTAGGLAPTWAKEGSERPTDKNFSK